MEIRECWMVNLHDWKDYFRTLEKRKGLKSVGMIHAQRHKCAWRIDYQNKVMDSMISLMLTTHAIALKMCAYLLVPP